MSKGQSMELFEILILVVGSSILLVISYFFLFRTTSTSFLISSEEMFNKIGDSMINFQFAKVSGTEKSLSHILVDGLISRDPMYVSYGRAFGYINVTLLIEDYFNDYFGNRWQLVLPSSKIPSLGNSVLSDAKTVQTFEIVLPFPSLAGKVAHALLKVW